VAGEASSTAGASLSRELTAFLVEFSVSLHKHAIYPSGHPSLEPAAARVTDIAAGLLRSRSTLAFGVARHQLIIDGVATDPNQPGLRRLAATLHRLHLGAMSIMPGVESQEIYDAFRFLSEEAASAGSDDSPPVHLPEWKHLRFHPLTLDRLQLVEGEVRPANDVDNELARRRAQLWVGLANAAMASEAAVLDPSDAAPDPDDVAKAIDGHFGTAAYDQVIVGYLVQIAEELKNSPVCRSQFTSPAYGAAHSLAAARDAAAACHHGRERQPAPHVRDGRNDRMAMDSVVKILKAAAEASGQTISHELMRMLSKLGAHAERGREHTRPVAEIELREQVDSLLSGWDLDDPAPEAMRRHCSIWRRPSRLREPSTTNGPSTTSIRCTSCRRRSKWAARSTHRSGDRSGDRRRPPALAAHAADAFSRPGRPRPRMCCARNSAARAPWRRCSHANRLT
jgi:hypothetical protein